MIENHLLSVLIGDAISAFQCYEFEFSLKYLQAVDASDLINLSLNLLQYTILSLILSTS